MADFIPSPYNFVPLEKDVFFPEGGQDVSMDVPFNDGISGFLEIEVTAKTPLYIRNGGEHPRNQNEKLNDQEYKDFYRVVPGGSYAIPGTSLKGMLRGVIEIISFGKIAGTKEKASRVVDNRYAIRDLQNRALYTKHITEELGRKTYRSIVRSAWLKRADNGGWQLTFCDMARVEQTDLERVFCKGKTLLAERHPAEKKYKVIPPYTEIHFDPGPETDHKHSRNNRLRYRKAANIGKGKTKGILVMTGQPARRDGNPGKKHMEFIFFNPSPSSVEVPSEVKSDFEFAHSNLGENRKENNEWAFWKKELEKGKEIPVFVLEKGRGKISSMGLAMMFRLPYTNSILETVSHTSPDHLDGSRLDLGESLFGRVEDTHGLRGRVSVETLLAEGEPKPLEEVATVLGSPKPTYYPNYIKQETHEDGSLKKGKEYKTYMDSNAEIRGWKRYLTRKDGNKPKVERAPTQSVETRFCPLPEGTTFRGRIYVHNLRPYELGALYWAITWGGDANLRHSLGMGKPLGYGSVTLSIADKSLSWCNPARSQDLDLEDCQKAFIDIMEAFKGKASWENSTALKALKTMANPQTSWREGQDPRYPSLSSKEFVEFKNKKKALLDPIQGMSGGSSPSSSAPSRGNTGRQERDGAGGAATSTKNESPKKKEPPKPPSPEEKLYEAIDNMKNKDLLKLLKKEAIDPQKVDPELRKKIAKKLERFRRDAQFRPFIKPWLE